MGLGDAQLSTTDGRTRGCFWSTRPGKPHSPTASRHTVPATYIHLFPSQDENIEKRGKSVLELINDINTSAAGLAAPIHRPEPGKMDGKSWEGLRGVGQPQKSSPRRLCTQAGTYLGQRDPLRPSQRWQLWVHQGDLVPGEISSLLAGRENFHVAPGTAERNEEWCYF